MKVPRRLYRTADGQFCEEDDPRQAWVFAPPAREIPDAEAERIGLKAYLDRTGWGAVAEPPAGAADADTAEAKAVTLGEAEDKAVAQGATENKAAEALEPGLHIDPALRRGGSGRRV